MTMNRASGRLLPWIVVVCLASVAEATIHRCLIRHDGRTYELVDAGREITDDDVGERLGVVRRDRTGPRAPRPTARFRDGDASVVDEGTEYFAMRGYSPKFRIMAKWHDEWWIFQVREGHGFRTGRDLYDLDGKVGSVTISDRDGSTIVATIDDPPTVRSLTTAILEARIDRHETTIAEAERQAAEPQYFLDFHLHDGTLVRCHYLATSRILDLELPLPESFGSVIDDAAETNRP